MLVASLVGAACVGTASAAGSFKLTLSSKRIAPGGRVTITTSPSLRCTLTITIAGRRFSHGMPYGWIRVKMPANFRAGTVPLSVNCGGHTVSSSFRVK